jgi:hypothetical protein
VVLAFIQAGSMAPAVSSTCWRRHGCDHGVPQPQVGRGSRRERVVCVSIYADPSPPSAPGIDPHPFFKRHHWKKFDKHRSEP